MAIVMRNGKAKQVKNLGWLVHKLGQELPIRIDVRGLESMENWHWECVLFVHFKNRILFSSLFASQSICWQWLNARRSLKGMPIWWLNHAVVLNGQEMPHE